MQKAMKFILLMGIVSLLGDITYEGARSVTGPFLSTLGVSAAMLGIIVGFGEFSGYALRLATGYIADRTKQYWLMTFVGYGLVLAIPLLALANRWEIAALLIILERAGKAIRSPSRDAILSYATKQVGRGWGFGIHEAMDQIGAFLGPMILFVVLYLAEDYREGFAVLLLPALLTLAALSIARSQYPAPHTLETRSEGSKELPRTFWLYTIFVFLSMLGFANFQILSYHFKVKSVIPDAYIPVAYAVAMGIDAAAALITGRTYDRIGLKTLILIPLLTPLVLLSFSESAVLAGIAAWGVVMGMQETIMRAAVADLVHPDRRSTAYGIFNTAYGLSWFAGSAMIGLLYDLSTYYLAVFVILAELAALLVLVILLRQN